MIPFLLVKAAQSTYPFVLSLEQAKFIFIIYCEAFLDKSMFILIEVVISDQFSLSQI